MYHQTHEHAQTYTNTRTHKHANTHTHKHTQACSCSSRWVFVDPESTHVPLQSSRSAEARWSGGYDWATKLHHTHTASLPLYFHHTASVNSLFRTRTNTHVCVPQTHQSKFILSWISIRCNAASFIFPIVWNKFRHFSNKLAPFCCRTSRNRSLYSSNASRRWLPHGTDNHSVRTRRGILLYHRNSGINQSPVSVNVLS
jgi:hypothetical protein